MLKKKKKFIILILSSALIIFGLTWGYFMFVPREQLFYGIPDNNGNTTMDGDSLSRGNIKDLHTVIDAAKKIDLTEEPTSTKQVAFYLDIRTHNDTELVYDGMLWYQEDGTAILKELSKQEYFQVDKQHTELLKEIFK